MQDEQRKTQRIVIIGFVAVMVLALVLLLSLGSHKNNAPTTGSGQTTTVTDPVSHETITTQKGKVPETAGQTAPTPLFAGFDKLIDAGGITLDQLNDVETAFAQYKPFANNNTQISLAVDDIQLNSPDPNDPNQNWSITSHVVVNQKTTYKIKITYSGIDSIELYIYDSTGASQLFDSGVVGTPSDESSPDT